MDQSSGARWCDTFIDIEGVVNLALATDIDPNSGAANTTAILGAGGRPDAGSAAEVASTYEWPNGQTDGFLPNKEELKLLYDQRFVVGGFSLSNDPLDYYWSSSKHDFNSAWFQDFFEDFQFDTGLLLDRRLRVRAVRTF